MSENDTGVTLSGTDFSVSVKEKRSTGDYENVETFASLSGELPHRDDLDEDTRKCIKAKLLTIHKDLQAVVERAADNRVAVEDAEDWGVYDDE